MEGLGHTVINEPRGSVRLGANCESSAAAGAMVERRITLATLWEKRRQPGRPRPHAKEKQNHDGKGS